MMTWFEAQKRFSTCKNKEKGKPIANNTRLLKDGKDFVIRLHQTNIVRITPNNEFILNSGGWHTNVTKERINEFSPASIYQKDFQWYNKNSNYPFYDGIKVNHRGQVVEEG